MQEKLMQIQEVALKEIEEAVQLLVIYELRKKKKKVNLQLF